MIKSNIYDGIIRMGFFIRKYTAVLAQIHQYNKSEV